MYVGVCMCMYMHVYVCMYTCVCVCICACVYVQPLFRMDPHGKNGQGIANAVLESVDYVSKFNYRMCQQKNKTQQ